MGKREVRVIVIRKWTTVALLLLISAGMAGLIYFLSGKAYARETHPAAEMMLRLIRRDDPSRDVFLAAMMPVIANALLFIPFGFLMFIALDSPRRRRSRTYLLTVGLGVAFAASMQIWQYALPTRVISPVDMIANALGTFTGAIGGHLRKRVHIRFDH